MFYTTIGEFAHVIVGFRGFNFGRKNGHTWRQVVAVLRGDSFHVIFLIFGEFHK